MVGWHRLQQRSSQSASEGMNARPMSTDDAAARPRVYRECRRQCRDKYSAGCADPQQKPREEACDAEEEADQQRLVVGSDVILTLSGRSMRRILRRVANLVGHFGRLAATSAATARPSVDDLAAFVREKH